MSMKENSRIIYLSCDRFILLDWIVEVSEMKEFSTRTLHLAINLVQRYMMARKLSRSRLQLLGVTALLLAARSIM